MPKKSKASKNATGADQDCAAILGQSSNVANPASLQFAYSQEV